MNCPMCDTLVNITAKVTVLFPSGSNMTISKETIQNEEVKIIHVSYQAAKMICPKCGWTH